MNFSMIFIGIRALSVPCRNYFEKFRDFLRVFLSDLNLSAISFALLSVRQCSFSLLTERADSKYEVLVLIQSSCEGMMKCNVDALWEVQRAFRDYLR